MRKTLRFNFSHVCLVVKRMRILCISHLLLKLLMIHRKCLSYPNEQLLQSLVIPYTWHTVFHGVVCWNFSQESTDITHHLIPLSAIVKNAVDQCFSVFCVSTHHQGVLLTCRCCSVDESQRKKLQVHVRCDGRATLATKRRG